MSYKNVSIIMQNGMVIQQKDIAKIVGSVEKATGKVAFEIDLSNDDDIYNLIRNFGKSAERKTHDLTRRHWNSGR
jgi:hypothetical protein